MLDSIVSIMFITFVLGWYGVVVSPKERLESTATASFTVFVISFILLWGYILANMEGMLSHVK